MAVDEIICSLWTVGKRKEEARQWLVILDFATVVYCFDYFSRIGQNYSI
jgi:hypothetical protein